VSPAGENDGGADRIGCRSRMLHCNNAGMTISEKKVKVFCALQHGTDIPDGADFSAFVTSRQTNLK